MLALCVRRSSDVPTFQQSADDRTAQAVVVSCDLRYEEDVVRMVHRVVQRLGRIDVVINAASILGPKLPVVDYPVEPWRNVIATNLVGTYLVCREVLPWMLRQGSGSIINVTSSVTTDIEPNWGAHLVSASGIDGLTGLLAAEVKGSGVCVNTVEMPAPHSASDGVGGDSDGDWANAFLWLAGEDSADISGERIRATGFALPSS